MSHPLRNRYGRYDIYIFCRTVRDQDCAMPRSFGSVGSDPLTGPRSSRRAEVKPLVELLKAAGGVVKSPDAVANKARPSQRGVGERWGAVGWGPKRWGWILGPLV